MKEALNDKFPEGVVGCFRSVCPCPPLDGEQWLCWQKAYTLKSSSNFQPSATSVCHPGFDGREMLKALCGAVQRLLQDSPSLLIKPHGRLYCKIALTLQFHRSAVGMLLQLRRFNTWPSLCSSRRRRNLTFHFDLF